MSVEFNSDIIVISEGLADKVFLQKMVEHWLPRYSVSFPFPTDKIGGVSQFATMLKGIRGARDSFARLKGILVVADSCDNPTITYQNVAAAITAADLYPVPVGLDVIARGANEHPSMAITTIPASNLAGGLETLYTMFFNDMHPRPAEAVGAFLSSPLLDVLTWNAEKQGKANYASFVAATCRDDPSRSASSAFRAPSLIDVSHQTFQPLSDQLKILFDQLIY